MASDTEATRVADVVKQEPDGYAAREVKLVDENQTLTIGEVVRKGAAGRMVAMAARANEKQSVVMAGTLTSGFFTITAVLSNGVRATSDPIAHDANAAALLAGLDTIFTSGDVEISAGTTPAAFTVHWIGEDYALNTQPLMDIDIEDMVGGTTCTVTRSQVGGGGTAVAANEVHTVTLDALAITSGTFTITVDHWNGSRVTTAAIAYNANIATCQAALDLVTGSTSQITMVGVPSADLSITFTYDGSMYAGRKIENLVTYNIGTTLGTTLATSVRTTQGGSAGETAPYGICIRDVTTGAGVYTTEGLFLTRGPAVVDWDKLDFGSGIELDIVEGLRQLGIQCRREA